MTKNNKSRSLKYLVTSSLYVLLASTSSYGVGKGTSSAPVSDRSIAARLVSGNSELSEEDLQQKVTGNLLLSKQFSNPDNMRQALHEAKQSHDATQNRVPPVTSEQAAGQPPRTLEGRLSKNGGLADPLIPKLVAPVPLRSADNLAPPLSPGQQQIIENHREQVDPCKKLDKTKLVQRVYQSIAADRDSRAEFHNNDFLIKAGVHEFLSNEQQENPNMGVTDGRAPAAPSATSTSTVNDQQDKHKFEYRTTTRELDRIKEQTDQQIQARMNSVNAKVEGINPQLAQIRSTVQTLEGEQQNLTQDVLQLQQQGAELKTTISSLFQELGRVNQQYLDQANKNRTIQTQVEDLKRAAVVLQTPEQWDQILQQQVHQEQKLIALQGQQVRIQNTLHQLQQQHSIIQKQLTMHTLPPQNEMRSMDSQSSVASSSNEDPDSMGQFIHARDESGASTSNAGQNRLEASAPPRSLYEDESALLNVAPNYYLPLVIENLPASNVGATTVVPPTVKPTSPTQLETVKNGLSYVASGIGTTGSTLVNGVASGIGSAAHWLASTVNSAGQYAGLTRGAPSQTAEEKDLDQTIQAVLKVQGEKKQVKKIWEEAAKRSQLLYPVAKLAKKAAEHEAMRTGDLGRLQNAAENKIHFRKELKRVADIASPTEWARIHANIAMHDEQFYNLKDALELCEQLSKAKLDALKNNNQNELKDLEKSITEQNQQTLAVINNLLHAREQVDNMIRVVRQNHTTPTPPNFRAAQVRIIDQQLHQELAEFQSIGAQYEDAKAASKLATKEQKDSARSAAIEGARERLALTHRGDLKLLRKALEDKIAFQLALPDLIEATPVTVQALQTNIEKHAQTITQLSREVYNYRGYNEGKILALQKSDEIGVTTLSEFITDKEKQLEGIISDLSNAKAEVDKKIKAAKQECAEIQGARNEMVTQAPGASQPEEHRRVRRVAVDNPSGPHQGPGDPGNDGRTAINNLTPRDWYEELLLQYGNNPTGDVPPPVDENPQAPAPTARDFATSYADMTEAHLRAVAFARANPLLVEDPQMAAATILSNQYLDLMEPSLVALAGGGNRGRWQRDFEQR